jgi:hypothetical protein
MTLAGPVGNASRRRWRIGLFCSKDADWITGQVIYAGGGASLMNPEVSTEIQIG